MRAAIGIALLVCAPAFAPACAQTVSMSGSLGDKAVLIIDGTPRTMAAGSTVQGVKLLGVAGTEAVVEVKGERRVLSLGAVHANLGGAPSAGGGSQIVLSAGPGGHFVAGGSINGKAVNFMVDTGATYVSMGAAEAERLGIDFRKGRRGVGSTANGQIVVYRVSLDSVRVGDVQVYNVDALVGQMPMEQVLLGNSFLARFQMKRENDTMTLSKRF
jgi:aspartyl protease family protein